LLGVAKALIAQGDSAAARPDLQQALAIYLEIDADDVDEVRDLLASTMDRQAS
jgi:hypothetical protein